MAKREERKKGGVIGTVKRVLNVFGVLLILLLMALCAFLIYQRVTGQEPKLFGYRLFEVQSGSMEPFIMTGDTILTKEIKDPEDVKLDDVVVFKNPDIWISVGKPEMSDQYIVHRVKEIRKEADGRITIVTLGDNNHGKEDPPTEITAVEAKYVGKISGGFFRFIRSPFGIIAVIAAIAAIFAAWRLVYALVEKRKKKNVGEEPVDDPDSDGGPDGADDSDSETDDGNGTADEADGRNAEKASKPARLPRKGFGRYGKKRHSDSGVPDGEEREASDPENEGDGVERSEAINESEQADFLKKQRRRVPRDRNKATEETAAPVGTDALETSKTDD